MPFAAGTDERCLNDIYMNNECTMPSFNPNDQGYPLYMTYWPGMTPKQCNSTSHLMFATPTETMQTALSAVIKRRDDEQYEACYWQIKAPDFKYLDSAKLYLQVQRVQKGSVYLYSGTDRHNATAVIENNATAVPGAPYLIPVSDSMIVVFVTEGGGMGGSV